MKKALSLILILVMSLSLCAYGSSNNTANTEEINETASIEVKGLFYLDPAEDLDLSEEGLSTAQSYLFLIYDVVNNSDKNIELSTFTSSITLTMNNTNSYEQLRPFDGDVLETFIENCGYSVSTSYGTLWGGSEPVRMIASFAINKNDIKDDCTAEIDFQLADDIKDNITVTAEEIQTINLPDGVFAVEENPDAYQIARSLIPCTEVCRNMIVSSVEQYNNREENLASAALSICKMMFVEGAPFGVSCASGTETNDPNIIFSEELSAFSYEAIRPYYPELVDKVESVASCITTMDEELKKDNPDYDVANTAYYSACDTLDEILAYFGVE